MGRGTPEQVAEFSRLTAKVSQRSATDDERARWRELRLLLAPAKAPEPPRPPPAQSKLPSVPPMPAVAPAASTSAATTGTREHPRLRRKLRIGWAPAKELHLSFTEEVSAGGLRLTAPAHLEPGTTLVVRLELDGPEREPLLAQARVVWCRRDGNHFAVGVELTGLRPEERARLEAWAQAATEKPA